MSTTWDRSWVRSAIVLAVSLKVTGLIVVMDWTGQALNPFDLPKSAYSRTTEWILLALLLAAVLGWGLGVFQRTRLHFFVVAVVVAELLATAFAPEPYLAMFGTQGRYLGLTFALDMVVLYLAVAAAFRTGRDWAILFTAVAMGAVVSLIYAWVQAAGLDPFGWVRATDARPFSTIGNPNTFGHLLSVVLGASTAGMILYRGRSRWVVRFAAGMLLVAVLFVSGLVATRGTVLGILAAMVVVPILFARLREPTWKSLFGAAAFLIVSSALVVGVLAGSPLGVRVAATLGGTAVIRDRLLEWEAAARATAARPLLGFGPDSFLVAWPAYRPAELVPIVGPGLSLDSAHNWVLQTATTTGLLGLAVTLATLVAFSIVLVRVGLVRNGTVAGIIVVALASYWSHALVSVGTIGVDWVPWLGYGATTALASAGSPPRALRRMPLWSSIVLVALALAIGAIGVRAFDANVEARRARDASDLRQGDVAVEHANKAVGLDAGRADYWNELGRAYFAAQRWKDAAGAFDGAIRRAPYAATYRSNLGRALAQMSLAGDMSRGGPDAAMEAARAAVQLDPNEPVTHVGLAQIASSLGQFDVALTAAVDAIALFPMDPSYDTLVAGAAPRVADTALVRNELERALSLKDSARLRITLGTAALRAGDRQVALDSARRALALDPNNADARALLRAAGG